ncbi:MAG: YkgJ family cysteine cluster protein [Desulfobacteraceae bacterium]
MDTETRVFLTPHQAVEAISLDFARYGPQPELFFKMVPIVLPGRVIILDRATGPDAWLRIGPKNRIRPVAPPDLGQLLLKSLKENPPALKDLLAICRLVFETSVTSDRDAATGCPLLRVESDMERFICARCGGCCRDLGFSDQCFETDVQRWRALGRDDIIARVGCSQGKDGAAKYRIWIDPESGTLSEICPWLSESEKGGQYYCRIQDIKPDICREYPFTRKHARMTGCNGSFQPDRSSGFPADCM